MLVHSTSHVTQHDVLCAAVFPHSTSLCISPLFPPYILLSSGLFIAHPLSCLLCGYRIEPRFFFVSLFRSVVAFVGITLIMTT